MINDGCMEGVDEVYGLHNFPMYGEKTKIQVADREMMAHMNKILIDINGKGGHGSCPERCLNPVPIAAEIYLELYKQLGEIQKEYPNVRFSFPVLRGGEACNVIVDKCAIQGTFRTFSKESEEKMLDVLKTTLEEITKKHNTTYDLTLLVGGEGAVINTPECAQFIRKAAKEHYGDEKVDHDKVPVYASEDFADFLVHAPGCFFFAVINNLPSHVTLHTSSYDFDDSIIEELSHFWYKIVKDRCEMF